jgi:Zn-finger nucleic acid-binding protein
MVYNQLRASYWCEYCDTTHVPEPDAQGMRISAELAPHACPVCRLRLVMADLQGFPVEICPGCHGLLFHQDQYGKAVKNLRAWARTPAVEPGPPPMDELRRPVNCPSCRKPMSTHIYGGPGNIVIDTCLDCGLVWLDHRELQRVLEAPGRDRRA